MQAQGTSRLCYCPKCGPLGKAVALSTWRLHRNLKTIAGAPQFSPAFQHFANATGSEASGSGAGTAQTNTVPRSQKRPFPYREMTASTSKRLRVDANEIECNTSFGHDAGTRHGTPSQSNLDLEAPSSPGTEDRENPEPEPEFLPGGPDPGDEHDEEDPGCLSQAEREAAVQALAPGPEPIVQLPQFLPEDPEEEDEPDSERAKAILDDQVWAQAFIEALENAGLDNENLDPSVLHRLRNPPTAPVEDDIDPVFRLCLEIYLATTNASGKTYEKVIQAIKRFTGETALLTLYQVKDRIHKITGIAPIRTDMCINSCVAFTGPFRNLTKCPLASCRHPRWDETKLLASKGKVKEPFQTFDTIPIGPQLQALMRSPDSAKSTHYRSAITADVLKTLDDLQKELDDGCLPNLPIYEDVFHGSDYLDAVRDGKIKEHDFVLMLSLDGAQLYEHKQSDCWIYIWIVMDHSPEVRYKKRFVLPGAVIPGPNKPKNLDSYLFPGLHHLSALQKEGLQVWDGYHKEQFVSNPYFHIGAADGPAMAAINGLAGHQGRMGCRIFCGMPGRLQQGANKYYPALLCPDNYHAQNSDHPDIDLRNQPLRLADLEDYRQKLRHVVEAPNPTQYRKRRLATGIVKPSIFSGLHSDHTAYLLSCFVLDLMHVPALNIPEHMIELWRGISEVKGMDTRDAWDWKVLVDDVWVQHGAAVAECTPYLPGSFDRPPRNPAEKISSGYKAWEYMLYFYVLGPGVFRAVLPEKYWRHYCRLVFGIRILLQRSITREQLLAAHDSLVTFCIEFEELYCQRMPERLHFVRQCLHVLIHIAPETVRMGPGCLYTQWTMERTIGNLGEEIRQPSQPFANLSERAVRRAQENAMIFLIPDLDPKQEAPQASRDIGDGYLLLTAHDSVARAMTEEENVVFVQFLRAQGEVIHLGWVGHVKRWSRLQLPNGQQTRSHWKEGKKDLNKLRIARMAKLLPAQEGGPNQFANIRYYFQFRVKEQTRSLAMVTLYTAVEKAEHELSRTTLAVFEPGQNQVVDAKSIIAGVAMFPYTFAMRANEKANPIQLAAGKEQMWLGEKPGMEIALWGGQADPMLQEDGEGVA